MFGRQKVSKRLSPATNEQIWSQNLLKFRNISNTPHLKCSGFKEGGISGTWSITLYSGPLRLSWSRQQLSGICSSSAMMLHPLIFEQITTLVSCSNPKALHLTTHNSQVVGLLQYLNSPFSSVSKHKLLLCKMHFCQLLLFVGIIFVLHINF